MHTQMALTNTHELDARMNFMIYGNYRSVVLTLMYIYYSVSPYTYTHVHTHARAPHAHIHTLTRQHLPIERPDFSDIVTRVTSATGAEREEERNQTPRIPS